MTASRARSVDVMLVDDDYRSSYSLWALLDWQFGIRVLEASGSADAFTAIQRERPAVCLVSAAVGPCCVHRLSDVAAAPSVLVYADWHSAELEGTAVIAGADGVLWRYDEPARLAETIRRAADKPHQPPEVDAETIRRLVDRVDDRDRPIAAMLLLRTPFDEIARTLGIGARALRARRWDIIRRLEETRCGSHAPTLLRHPGGSP